MYGGTICAIIKLTNASIYFGSAQSFEIDLLWLAGNAKTLEISRDFRSGDLKGCSLPKRDAIQMDGISFWNMGSAANPWFDRPMILGASPASALRAGGFGNQPKQSPWRHGGGIAAGVLPYCPIHPPIHSVRMAQRKTPSLWMVFFVGARFPQRTRGFDHKYFAVARRLRCTASQLLAQPKENA